MLTCSKHELRPLKGFNPMTFDYTLVMNWVVAGKTGSRPFEWCMICPNPAFYACCTPVTATGGLEGEATGCGLVICDNCALAMICEHGGILSDFLASLDKNDSQPQANENLLSNLHI